MLELKQEKGIISSIQHCHFLNRDCRISFLNQVCSIFFTTNRMLSDLEFKKNSKLVKVNNDKTNA